METENECEICYETFSKSRKKIECTKCCSQICTKCFEISIRNQTTMPHCVSCKEEYNVYVLCQKIPKATMKRTNDWIAHLDTEKEKNKLPIAMSYLADVDEAERLEKQSEKISLAIEKLKKQQRLLEIRAHKLRNGEGGNEKTERNTFICPCPAINCNGFLNTRYRCGICNTKVCKSCKMILPEDEEHKCNADDVESVKFIKQTTKPCPKCGTRIHRPGGCSHMFCTKPGCNTSFDWNSGKQIPHSMNTAPDFYRWVNSGESGLGIRTQNGNCDVGIENITVYDLRQSLLSKRLMHTDINDILSFHRVVNHFRLTELHRYRNTIEDNMDLSIKFLKKEIDEKHWKSTLKRRRKKTNINTQVTMMIELFINLISELLSNIMFESDVDVIRECMLKMKNAIKISDIEMTKILKNFGSKRHISFIDQYKLIRRSGNRLRM